MPIYKLLEGDLKDYYYLEFFRNNNNLNDSYFKDGYNIEDLKHSFTKNIIKSSLKDKTIKSCIRFALNNIINVANEILQSNGLNNSTTTYGLVEYHRYLDGCIMPFEIHYDDFGAVDYTVNTVIFYISKTVEGGNLQIYDDDEKLIETIDVKPQLNKIKIVVMEGNVLHCISQIKNSGIRECVVVQLKCKR